MKPPIVTCPNCHGTGQAKLGRDHCETLKRLRKAKKTLTTFDLVANGIGLTAIANRLVALERMGLAERVGKAGKNILWKATI